MLITMIVLLLVSGAGVALAVFGWSLKQAARERATWSEVDAVVTGIEERPGLLRRRRIVLEAPVLRYAVDGVEYTRASPLASYPPRCKVGDAIRLRVNSANPDETEEPGGDLWADVSGTLLGVGLLLVALVLLFVVLVATGYARPRKPAGQSSGPNAPPAALGDASSLEGA